MKAMVMAAFLASAGFAQAQSSDELITMDLAENSGESVAGETSEPAPTLSRKKRGVGPVAGMSCEGGYKQVGDDCVAANVEFE